MMKFFRSLLFWEGLSFTVAFLGSRAMDENSMLWYSGLVRSAFNLFPVVDLWGIYQA